jgi:hypothetical protein
MIFLDASNGSTQAAIDALNSCGCFGLRGAIRSTDLEFLHNSALAFFQIAVNEGKEGIARATGLPLGHISGHAEGARSRGVFHHSLLSWYLYRQPDKLERVFAEMISDDRILRFVSTALGHSVLHTNNMAIRYRDVGRNKFALPFHQDSFSFNHGPLASDVPMLIVWVPFTSIDQDTPGLEIVPKKLQAGVPLRHVPRTQFKHLEADVPDDLATWYPYLERGDCLIFWEHTLHRSHGGDVRKPRTSVDIRVFAEGMYPKALNGDRGLRLPSLEPVSF